MSNLLIRQLYLRCRVAVSLARLRRVLRRPLRPDVAACRLNWNRPLQRESRDTTRGRWRRWRLVVSRRRTPQLVPAHVRGDVLVKRWPLAVSPVLVKDIELQRVTV